VKDLAGSRLKCSHSWSSKPGTCASSQSESWIRRNTSLYTSSFWRWCRGWLACDNCTALLPQLSMSCSITMNTRDQHHTQTLNNKNKNKKKKKKKNNRERERERERKGIVNRRRSGEGKREKGKGRGKTMEIQLTENSFWVSFILILLGSLSRY